MQSKSLLSFTYDLVSLLLVDLLSSLNRLHSVLKNMLETSNNYL